LLLLETTVDTQYITARAVTAETVLLLAKRFGTSAGLWMNLQTAHDLAVAREPMAA
jgi:plasmid maintenance system antidote protein VapI